MRTTKRFRTTSTAVGATLTIAALLAGCSSTAGSGASTSPSPSDPAVRNAMTAFLATGAAPGVVAVIQRGSQQSVLGEGTAETTTGRAMTGDAVMRIASVSKAYSGAVILALVSEGKLSLDATIGQLLPTAPTSWGSATVAQVLQHTSGLPDYIKSPGFIADFSADPQMQRTPEQLIAYVADEPPAFTPGSQYQYSDTDNIIAGLIAEQVTGKPYTEVLKAYVTDPLQATSTSLPSTSAMPSGFIHGYEPVTAEPAAAAGSSSTASPSPSTSASAPAFEDVSEILNPSLAWASGGMITTPLELNTFIRAYASGKLGGATTVSAQRTFVPGGGGPPGPGENSSGLAIYQYVTACGTVLGHTGNMPGYTVFTASTADGANSVVVGVNGQVSQKSPEAYDKMVAVWNEAICAANGTTPASATG